MKKIVSLFFVFAFLANVSAQLKVDASGNVGIGVTNPKYKLHVVGDTYVTGNIYLGKTTNFLNMTGNTFTLKVNDILAGYMESSSGSNLSFGYGALYTNTTGSYNTAIGYKALHANTTGERNAATGYYALLDNTEGSYNTANGGSALRYNTTGSYNTANGYQAIYSNTIGNYNAANGYNALRDNTEGSYNTANGCSVLRYNTTGINNTASGYKALYNNATGNYNTATGYFALYKNTTGSNNTAVGYYADVSAKNLTNATAIGNEAKATASNQVRIGNSSVTSIGGYAAWTNFSDGRAKKNIRTNVPGLDFINRLQPVTYNLDLDMVDNLMGIDKTGGGDAEDGVSQPLSKEMREAREAKQKQVQTGFVAQDVEKTAKSVGYDFDGVDVDENGVYGLRYSEFVVPLVKAVQELSEQNERLQEQINQLLGKENESSILRSSSGESSITGIVNPVAAQCKLYQNAPNPLTHSTVIKFYIPENINTAFLNIYNMEGKQLMQIPITERGENSHQILGHHFSAGMYLYTLIADGTVVDTKRMILTK